MDLCHAVILNKNFALSHKILSLKEAKASPLLLAGPVSFPFITTALVALKEPEVVTEYVHEHLELKWVISIVDDLEKKLLIKGCTESRSLFWLGELIDGMAVAFMTTGFDIKTIEPDVVSGAIAIHFLPQKQVPARKIVGHFMCLTTVVDSLLFSRGLLMGDSHLDATNVAQATKPLFDCLKHIAEV